MNYFVLVACVLTSLALVDLIDQSGVFGAPAFERLFSGIESRSFLVSISIIFVVLFVDFMWSYFGCWAFRDTRLHAEKPQPSLGQDVRLLDRLITSHANSPTGWPLVVSEPGAPQQTKVETAQGRPKAVPERHQKAPRNDPVRGRKAPRDDAAHSLKLYTVAIYNAAKVKDTDRANELFAEVCREGLVPDTTLYTCMIYVCGQARDAEKAEGWMVVMLKAGVQPSHRTISALLDALAKVPSPQNAARAQRWFDRMGEWGLTPDQANFSSILNAHAKVGDVASAMSLLDRMEESSIQSTVYSYTCVLDACGRSGGSEAQATRLFERMRSNGIQPTIASYGLLCRVYSLGGNYLGAERLRTEMEEEGIRMNRYFLCGLLWAYAKARPRQEKRARQVFLAEAPDMVAEHRECEKFVMQALSACVGAVEAGNLADQALGKMCVTSG